MGGRSRIFVGALVVGLGGLLLKALGEEDGASAPSSASQQTARASSGSVEAPDKPRESATPPTPPASQSSAARCSADQLAWAVNQENHLKIFGDQFVPDLIDAILGPEDDAVCKDKSHPAYGRPAVIDVGANIGQGIRTWLHLARCPEAKIVAFEPHPRTFHVLKEYTEKFLNEKSVELERVALVNAAAGDAAMKSIIYENFGARRTTSKDGVKRLRQLPWSEHGSTYASMHRTHSYNSRPVNIDVVRVDEAVPKQIGDRGILLLKTDCEGHDQQALFGAEGILDKVETIIFEYNRLWQSVNNSLQATQRFLHKKGFAVFLLGGKIIALDEPTTGARDFDLYPEQQLTGFAIRRGSRAACSLTPFVLNRTTTADCTPFLRETLGCPNPPTEFKMGNYARSDYHSNFLLSKGGGPSRKRGKR
eukprot:Hpha_TRINITY_DN17062_c0_g1::TRINITY_DN17062_c0_g1_i1::g.166978::m.166978